MNDMGVKERVLACLAAVSFFVVIVGLLSIAIAEDQGAQHQWNKRKPMLGVISNTNSVR